MCIYWILLISAILPAIYTVKYIKISPDSMIYGLISQEIISGNGIKLPIIINMEDNHLFINGLAPHLEEPPLLPILYATLGGVAPQNYLAAQIINVISHAAISIFTFLLMKKLYDKKGFALLSGILASISYPMLWNTHHMISEPLFIALTVAMLYFLVLSRHSDSSKSTKYFFVAGACASLAILTRYAGLALVPVFIWEALLRIKNKKTKYVSVILTATLPVITAVTLFTRSYLITGTIFGRNPPPPERSYLSALMGTIKMMLLQFNLGERPVTLIAIFLTLAVLFLFLNSAARRELSRYFHSGLDLLLLFMVSYTALISFAMTTAQTVFELRFMSPLVPIIFILCIITILMVCEQIRINGLKYLPLFVIILSLGIITLGSCYKTYIHLGDFTPENGRQYFVPNSSTYSWLKENYGRNVIITTNKSFPLSFFGGYSTVQLPHKRFQENFRIPEDMETFLPGRMSAFGSRVLVLFEAADEHHEGSYIAGLFNKRDDDDNFVLIRQFPDGVVYKLKE